MIVILGGCYLCLTEVAYKNGLLAVIVILCQFLMLVASDIDLYVLQSVGKDFYKHTQAPAIGWVGDQ